MPNNQDGAEERVCVDCGERFLYTAAEQRFRSEQGMAGPSRCPRCRASHRAERNADLLDNRAPAREEPPRDRRRSKRDGGDGASGRYPAVCADCGKTTMVPFIPRGDRPVYCRSCFNARRGR
jgi:CxxC-x17-CxxC domain-containing protein